MTTPDLPPRIDPMQDPMRPGYFMNYATDESPAETVLRKLACWLGVGGYNAPTVDAGLFHRKIVDGIDSAVAAAVLAERERANQREPDAWNLIGNDDVFMATEFTPDGEHRYEWRPLYFSIRAEQEHQP